MRRRALAAAVRCALHTRRVRCLGCRVPVCLGGNGIDDMTVSGWAELSCAVVVLHELPRAIVNKSMAVSVVPRPDPRKRSWTQQHGRRYACRDEACASPLVSTPALHPRRASSPALFATEALCTMLAGALAYPVLRFVGVQSSPLSAWRYP